MAMIDLSEIPLANSTDGEQDKFELFARDFLEALGYKIIEGPGRGIDRGRDLLISENFQGTFTDINRTWLVSCKHKIHSGRSVTNEDEQDPIGRVRRFEADGFMAFYSTIPSSGLDDTFSRIRSQIDVYIFDSGRIAQLLLSQPGLVHVMKNYLPTSFQRVHNERNRVVKVWGNIEPLTCCYCGKDLLLEDDAIVASVEEYDPSFEKAHIRDMYWACKGKCDEILDNRVQSPLVTVWEDISDLRIPLVFLRWVIATMNNLRSGEEIYDDEAYKKAIFFIQAMAQTVLKETSVSQWERIGDLQSIPSSWGGLGYE